MALDLDAIRARAEAARQAAASGTTGTPPNVDGLSIHDALDIFAESAEDVPALLEEVEALREGIATGDRMLNQAMLRAEGAEDDRDRLAALLAYARESRDAYAATLDRLQYLVDVANEWRPVVSRDEGECFPAVVVDDLIENLRTAIEGTDS